MGGVKDACELARALPWRGWCSAWKQSV